nr:hypothetical protein GCM10020093_002570 [Planobispora longispora]
MREAGPLAGVLALRPREWRADVVVRLASRVRPDRDASLALNLLRALGSSRLRMIRWSSSGRTSGVLPERGISPKTRC